MESIVKVQPITGDEHECRSCLKFSHIHKCWIHIKKRGKECEDYVFDKRQIGRKVRYKGQ